MKIKYREIDESVHLSPHEITTISAMKDKLKIKEDYDVRFRNRKEYRKVSVYKGNFRTEGSERFYFSNR